MRCCRVPEDKALAEYWPLPLRLRNALVRRLPAGAVNGLAQLKARGAARWADAAEGVPTVQKAAKP